MTGVLVILRRKGLNVKSVWIAYLAAGEKSFMVYIRCPYRKPTQVGRKKILRPTGEGLLRNSAN